MAAYFQLYKKGETSPSRFSDIDNEMCKHFGVQPDEIKYFRQWYDFIGFNLAMGMTFEDIKKQYMSSPRMLHNYDDLFPVAQWLEANYVSDSWFSR